MDLVRFRYGVRPVSRFNFLSVRLCVCLFVCAFVPRKGFSLALFICFGIRL